LTAPPSSCEQQVLDGQVVLLDYHTVAPTSS
jgi:hypothetical protein